MLHESATRDQITGSSEGNLWPNHKADVRNSHIVFPGRDLSRHKRQGPAQGPGVHTEYRAADSLTDQRILRGIVGPILSTRAHSPSLANTTDSMVANLSINRSACNP
jgi:hypothetical protein